MKKQSLVPKTIDEKIIQDMLSAVGTLEQRSETKENYFLVGGIAVQSYLPSMCRRPTSDVDLAVLKPLNYSDFRDFSKTVREYLQDKGYDVEMRKASRAYSLEVNSKDNSCIIEFARRNTKNFERIKHRLQRELAHSRKKIVEGTEFTYTVSTPEDIVIPKLARSVHALMRKRRLEKNLPKRKGLSEEIIRKRLKKISDLRKEAMYSPSSIDIAEELRLVSDLYDVRVLSELVGFNESYLNESARNWDILTTKSYERDLLIEKVLPVIDLNFYFQ